MKKNFFRIAAIALAAMLVITGCSNDNGANVSTKTVRVIGTYGKMEATASARALSRAGETDQMGITSVDKVVVNGKDIKNDLKPAEGQTLTEGANNITFEAQVEVSSTVNFSAEAKPGYVFDEWKVDKKTDKPLRKEIKKWLDKGDREESETLVDLPSNYIPHLVAEYDNGYYVSLDATANDANNGTHANPLAITELADAVAKSTNDKDELTIIVMGTKSEAFTDLFNALASIKGLEELKIKAEDAVALAEIPTVEGLKEIEFNGFTFSAPLTINNKNMELSFENCTFDALVIEYVGEIEIEESTAKSIKVITAKEAEFENLTVTEKIDLSAMTAGKVEIEDIPQDKIVIPENKDVKVEFDD